MKRTTLVLTLLTMLGAGAVSAADLNPPVSDGPVEVTVLIYTLDINAIDSGRQSFTANVYLEYSWTDLRLQHNGQGPVIRGMDEIWHPHLQVLNQQKLSSTFPEQLEVHPDGTVLYRQRVWGDFTQAMDLHDYPMDTQKLTIQLLAAGFSPDQVALVPAAGFEQWFSPDLVMPDFEITGSEMVAEPYHSVYSDRTIASIRSTYLGSRRYGYHAVKVILPLILIVMMSWAVFWIDPSLASPQLSIATTTMLTLIAYRFAIGTALPKVAYLTRLDTFIMVSTVMVFLTLMQAVVTTRLAASGRLEQAQMWDRRARLIFPAAFLILIIVSFLI